MSYSTDQGWPFRAAVLRPFWADWLIVRLPRSILCEKVFSRKSFEGSSPRRLGDYQPNLRGLVEKKSAGEEARKKKNLYLEFVIDTVIDKKF